MRSLHIRSESWPLRRPFRITGRSFDAAEVIVVEIYEGDYKGRAEAAGIFYLNETVSSMAADIEAIRAQIEKGVDRNKLQMILPPGGARNAIDCALWDLESKKAGARVWSLWGIDAAPVPTVNTVGVGSIDEMVASAGEIEAKTIKVKLDAQSPVERIEAIRRARPDSELVIDVNQGWTFDQLRELAPAMKALGVGMIEQPLPREADAELEGYAAPVPLCADESCLDFGEVSAASKRYQMINIKLDKCGGLTEAMKMVFAAKATGLDLMVGNMLGTSLAMAPAFVVAQRCKYVDLDGPTLLADDRENSMSYAAGRVTLPQAALWG